MCTTETVDFVHVMQRGTADCHPAHLHGLKQSNRGERSGAANLDEDVIDNRGLLTRRIFVGDGPTWGLRGESKLVLQAPWNSP